MRKLQTIAATLLLSGPILGQNLIQRWEGEAGANLGRSIAAAGDVDGDGVLDVALGDDLGTTVFSSADGSELMAWDAVPRDLAGGADLDGDGFPDIVVGYLTVAGDDAVSVFSGRTGAPLWSLTGEVPGDSFGQVVDLREDVDGDGVADVAVGTEAYDGTAYVYSGVDGSSIWRWEGEGEFGAAVSTVPDLDGDGVADVAVGAWDVPDTDGQVLIYSGATGGQVMTLEEGRGRFGWDVAGLADVDGDGLGDLLVGNPNYNNGGIGFGAAYVFSGGTGTLLYRHEGLLDDEVGEEVAAAGDTNGDGREDVLVGAPGRRPGNAYLYSGPTGGLLQAWGDRDGAMGNDVAGAGDVDGDGLADLLVANDTFDGAAGRNSGRVYLYSGARGLVLSPPDPGVAGVPNTFTVTGATPGSTIYYAIGFDIGGFYQVPGCPRGVEVSIANPDIIGTAIADAGGVAVLQEILPPGAQGATRRFQAAQRAPTCSLSDIVVTTFD